MKITPLGIALMILLTLAIAARFAGAHVQHANALSAAALQHS